MDYVQLNRLSKVLTANPKLPFPPPPNVVNQKLSQIVNQTKEEGNALFRTHQWEKAIGRYTQAAGFAMQRAPWEAQQLLREELSTVLSNRSAAHFENGDLVSAITDADSVIQLKKPWSKGHFRKAKALIALGLLPQAKEAVQYGLQFDPTNVEMMGVLQDIELVLRSYANQPRPGDLEENAT
jgi:translocation protein SEC72